MEREGGWLLADLRPAPNWEKLSAEVETAISELAIEMGGIDFECRQTPMKGSETIVRLEFYTDSKELFTAWRSRHKDAPWFIDDQE